MNPVIPSTPQPSGVVAPNGRTADQGSSPRGPRFTVMPGAPEPSGAATATGGPASVIAARIAAPPQGEPVPDAIVGYRFNAPAIAVRMLEPAPKSP